MNKSILKILHDFADGKDIFKETSELIELTRRYKINSGDIEMRKTSNSKPMVS